jgi:hypothetical protein
MSPAINAEGRPVFHTLVVYEDYAAGRRATDTCNLLMDRLGGECELRCNLLKFEALRNSRLSAAAAVEAREADVIIIAAHGSEPLPAEVTAWVDNWLQGRGPGPAALIAVMDSAYHQQARSSATSDYLRSVAAVAKMDFLSQVTAFSPNEHPVANPALRVEAESSSAAAATRWDAAERHWGINE